MTDLDNERHRGARANAIMTDPLMIESFEMLKNTYFDAWANSVPTDTATRELDDVQRYQGTRRSTGFRH